MDIVETIIVVVTINALIWINVYVANLMSRAALNKMDKYADLVRQHNESLSNFLTHFMTNPVNYTGPSYPQSQALPDPEELFPPQPPANVNQSYEPAL